jgi:Kef-type K+ transport system membrane component KefB/predicted transcriptional regulator
LEEINLGVLFILGVVVFGGILGAWLFQKLRIPQVVGYIAIGLLLGESGLNLITHQDVISLGTINLFALGIIGFLVGGELKTKTFRKYARQFTAILLCEGIGAFLLVGALSTAVIYLITGNLIISIAAGVVFGAIASATDPASTIDVLWEYRSKGILTTSITAIVALDDALAMTLYGLGTSVAQILTSTSGSILSEIGNISIKLFGAVILGLLCGLLLRFLMRWIFQPEKSLALAIGILLLLISISVYTGFDVILASMSLGFTLVNLAPRVSRDLFKVVRVFSSPIYVLFFVLIGARLVLNQMPLWLWGIVAVYVIGRSIGKIGGAWIGASLTGSEPVVRNYLGMGLIAQGGVAVGLSITASQNLAGISISQNLSLGDVIIYGITATTLIAQITGPALVKLSVKLAGEAGRNVTEDDIIDTLTVENVMDKKIIHIPEDMSMTEVVRIFTENEPLFYPVVNTVGALIGTLSLANMKSLLADQGSWNWLIVSDILEPLEEKTTPTVPLRKVLTRMRKLKIDQIPVVAEDDTNIPVGMLDISKINKRVEKRLISVRQTGA